MRIFASITLSALILGMIAPGLVTPVQAQTTPTLVFNPNLIIGDDQLLDTSSMDQSTIQEYLGNHPGILKNYSVTEADGTVKSAAQIINEAAQGAQINAKFLLTTLQKEESLIDDPSPSQTQLDWATGYGFCDSCTTTTPSIQKYKGFENQGTNAAQLVRRYLMNLATIGVTTTAVANTWGPGKTNNILCIASDAAGGRNICVPGTKIAITPANYVTSILYTYTPHPGGNYSFWKIWNGYNFNQHRMYPDGTLLQAKGSSVVYIIQSGIKRPFSSQTSFLAQFSTKQIIFVTADTLAQYNTGNPIYFANYSLLSTPKGGVYLLVNDLKRPVKSKAAMIAAGLVGKPVIKTTWDVLNQFPEGEAVTTADVYPAGAILQSTKNGMVFYVKDGVKYPVPTSDIYKNQFGTQKTIKVTAAQLDTYTWGAYVGFRDGSLVQNKTGGSVYFISNGYKLPIPTAAAAKAYGFDKIMANLIKTNDKSLAVHPEGQALDVDTNMVTVARK